MRTFATLIGGIMCVCLGGCGEVGEPLYPALRVPSRVIDLTAVERGDHLDVHFTIPAMTTEGLVLKEIGGVDLRIGPSANTPFNLVEWVNNATRAPAPPVDKPGSVTIHVPAAQFIGKDVIVSVRVANTRGRNSEWSNLATVRVEQPLATPADVKAQSAPQGVALSWSAPGSQQFRVYRKAAEETMPSVLATVNAPNYADTTAEYGKTYEYYVGSFRDKTVSDVVGPLSITPQDTFPPHVPIGLTASAGLNSIELAWDRNPEPDFKEYRVTRSEEGGPFVPIAQGLEAPAYSDQKIESGKHYRYRVAAVDQAGNVSEPSEPVEAVAP